MILNKSKNAKSGVIWGFLDKIVVLIFPFIIRTIIIHKLGSEYAGLGSLFTSILQVLSLAELGFGTAMVYSMYKPIVDDDKTTLSALLRYYKRIYLVMGLVILAIGLCVLPFVRYLIKDDVPADVNIYILFSIYLCNTVISYFTFAYRASLLSAYQREDINSIVNLIIHLFLFGAQVLCLILYPNYYLYIIWLPISTLAFNIFRYLIVKKKYPEIKPVGDIDEDKRKEIKKSISSLICHRIGGVIVNSADNIIISIFLGLVVLSNYNNYYYLITAISGFILIIFTSLCAGVGNSILVHTKEENERYFYKIFFINGAAVVFCTICFFNLYQPFIELWVGQDKLFPFLTMVLFCIYFFIHMIRRTIIMYRDAYGAWKDNRFQPIVSALFNLIVNIILVQFIGVNGIILSTILSMILIDIPWETITFFRNTSKYNVKKYIIYSLIFILASVVACVPCYFIKLNFKPILNVILYLGISIGAFLITFLIFFAWMPEFRMILRRKNYSLSGIQKKSITVPTKENETKEMENSNNVVDDTEFVEVEQ